MFGRLGQLVYTVTALPGIDRLALRLDGRAVDVFSGEGIVLGGPVGRDFLFDSGIVPPILVEHPAIGEPATRPVRLSGYAHRLVGGRFDWSLTRGGEDRLSSGSVSVPGAEGAFATTIAAPAGETGRMDLVVESKSLTGQTAFLRQLPFTISATS